MIVHSYFTFVLNSFIGDVCCIFQQTGPGRVSLAEITQKGNDTV